MLQIKLSLLGSIVRIGLQGVYLAGSPLCEIFSVALYNSAQDH